MGKTRVKFEKTPSYDEAEDILSNLHTGETCMRNYAKEYIGEDKAGEADYLELLYYRRKIIGLAEKIITFKTSKIEKKVQDTQPKQFRLNFS
jgi:hypothetical protein